MRVGLFAAYGDRYGGAPRWHRICGTHAQHWWLSGPCEAKLLVGASLRVFDEALYAY